VARAPFVSARGLCGRQTAAVTRATAAVALALTTPCSLIHIDFFIPLLAPDCGGFHLALSSHPAAHADPARQRRPPHFGFLSASAPFSPACSLTTG